MPTRDCEAGYAPGFLEILASTYGPGPYGPGPLMFMVLDH